MRLQRVRLELSLLSAWVLAIVFGCCACACAWALAPDKAFEQFVANRWSIQDGLPQISVLSIAQDRSGYLWVGTQNGLARFDGVRFTSFTPDNTPQMPGIWVRALLLDRNGKLWIGTYKGLAVYADGQFTAVPPANAAAHPALDVNSLAQAADGSIVAATSDGVLRVVDGKLVDTGPTLRPALSLLLRPDGLWVGSSGAALRVEGNQAIRMALPANASTAAVTRLVEAQGRIWAGTSQGLFFREGDAWVPFGDPVLASAPVGALFEDHDHNLWVGANPSLARLRDGKLVETIVGTAPITYKNVTTAYEDREGNLWFGSQVEGLTRLWNGWTRRYSVADGLSDPVVWSLARGNDGTIWVGTSDGVSVLDDGRFRSIAPGAALPHPHAYNLLAETDRLWIGTRRGLAEWHDGRIETSPIFAPMADAQINGIVREPDGALWFPTSNGLFRLEHEGQPDARLRLYGKADGLTDVRVRVILWVRDGSMLVGTESGLFEMRGERFVPTGSAAGLPRDIDVTAIHQMPSGAIAIGTMSEQLFVLDRGRWNRFGPAQGMPTNATFFMAEDDQGFLWMTGIRGITRVPVVDLEQYARGDIGHVRGEMVLNERGDRNAGQQGYCCNGAGMSKGYIDGHVLWLPSRDGVVAVDTHGIVKNPLAPHVVIERVSYRGAWHQAGSMPAMLEADARDLTFEFTAPSFQDPRSIQIRYQLIGYDRTWHVLDDPGRRLANYTNLPPGDYTFEVKAANNAGVWNPVPARLVFGIRPNFHETRLFYLLLGLVLAMLVYAGYRRQRIVHGAQRQLLEQQVRDRTEELHTANERLENVSQTDPLTGLRNRRYLDNQIPADLAFYDREQLRTGNYDQVILFALVDIDHFKVINDTHGHRAGDRVLQQVAQVLTALVRSGDYVARWGGEEFLLVFRPMPHRYLEVIGNRIRAALADHVFDIGSEMTLRLTCSLGISEYPLFRNAQNRLGWEQMIELADGALYWVKQNGRNGWAAFRPTATTDLATLMRDLHTIPQSLLDEGRLQLLGSRTTPSDAPEVRA